MVIACLRREVATWPLFIREPANRGFYLRKVWDGLREKWNSVVRALLSLFPALLSASLFRLDLCLELLVKFGLQFALWFKKQTRAYIEKTRQKRKQEVFFNTKTVLKILAKDEDVPGSTWDNHQWRGKRNWFPFLSCGVQLKIQSRPGEGRTVNYRLHYFLQSMRDRERIVGLKVFKEFGVKLSQGRSCPIQTQKKVLKVLQWCGH